MGELSLFPWDFYHLSAIGIKTIDCMVVVRLCFRGDKVIKIDMHFQPDPCPTPVGSLLNLILIQVLFTVPKEISLNLEETLITGIRGMTPLTADALGRKLSFVVDFDKYSQVGKISDRKDLLVFCPNLTSDADKGFDDLKIKPPLRDDSLPISNAVSDPGRDQSRSNT